MATFVAELDQSIFFLITILLGGTPVLAQQSPIGKNVTVTYGDTLSLIAERCNTRLDAVIAANPQLKNPNVIEVGMSVCMECTTLDPKTVREAG